MGEGMKIDYNSENPAKKHQEEAKIEKKETEKGGGITRKEFIGTIVGAAAAAALVIDRHNIIETVAKFGGASDEKEMPNKFKDKQLEEINKSLNSIEDDITAMNKKIAKHSGSNATFVVEVRDEIPVWEKELKLYKEKSENSSFSTNGLVELQKFERKISMHKMRLDVVLQF